MEGKDKDSRSHIVRRESEGKEVWKDGIKEERNLDIISNIYTAQEKDHFYQSLHSSLKKTRDSR